MKQYANLISGQNWQFSGPCDLKVLIDDSKNNKAPLLYRFKLWPLFCSHLWIRTRVTVQKPMIWVKIVNFVACVTLKFDGWPQNTTGHLFYATSSFIHHFIAIWGFKLEFKSGNAQLGSNHRNAQIGVKFWPMWPWPFAWTSLLSMVITPENFMIWWDDRNIVNKLWRKARSILRAACSQLKTIGYLFYATSSFVNELSLAAFWGTVDIGVHVVHTSCVIIAYTLKSLSSLT